MGRMLKLSAAAGAVALKFDTEFLDLNANEQGCDENSSLEKKKRCFWGDTEHADDSETSPVVTGPPSSSSSHCEYNPDPSAEVRTNSTGIFWMDIFDLLSNGQITYPFGGSSTMNRTQFLDQRCNYDANVKELLDSVYEDGSSCGSCDDGEGPYDRLRKLAKMDKYYTEWNHMNNATQHGWIGCVYGNLTNTSSMVEHDTEFVALVFEAERYFQSKTISLPKNIAVVGTDKAYYDDDSCSDNQKYRNKEIDSDRKYRRFETESCSDTRSIYCSETSHTQNWTDKTYSCQEQNNLGRNQCEGDAGGVYWIGAKQDATMCDGVVMNEGTALDMIAFVGRDQDVGTSSMVVVPEWISNDGHRPFASQKYNVFTRDVSAVGFADGSRAQYSYNTSYSGDEEAYYWDQIRTALPYTNSARVNRTMYYDPTANDTRSTAWTMAVHVQEHHACKEFATRPSADNTTRAEDYRKCQYSIGSTQLERTRVTLALGNAFVSEGFQDLNIQQPFIVAAGKNGVDITSGEYPVDNNFGNQTIRRSNVTVDRAFIQVTGFVQGPVNGEALSAGGNAIMIQSLTEGSYVMVVNCHAGVLPQEWSNGQPNYKLLRQEDITGNPLWYPVTLTNATTDYQQWEKCPTGASGDEIGWYNYALVVLNGATEADESRIWSGTLDLNKDNSNSDSDNKIFVLDSGNMDSQKVPSSDVKAPLVSVLWNKGSSSEEDPQAPRDKDNSTTFNSYPTTHPSIAKCIDEQDCNFRFVDGTGGFQERNVKTCPMP